MTSAEGDQIKINYGVENSGPGTINITNSRVGPGRERHDHSAPVSSGPARTAPNDEPAEVFLSHAGEDKDMVARPLASALRVHGITVFFDELSIRVGASIRRSIEDGIARCRFGIVVLSPHFLVKQWTQAELDGLYGRQLAAGGPGFLLPVWHGVTYDDLLVAVPTLADIKALNTASMGIGEIARQLAATIQGSR